MRPTLPLAIALVVGVVAYWLWPEPPASDLPRARPEVPGPQGPSAPQRVPEVPSLTTPAPNDEAEATGTVPTGRTTYRRTFTVRVEDQAHRPIAGASITRPPGYLGGAGLFLAEDIQRSPDAPAPPRTPPPVQTLCSSDGDGRCAFTVNEDCLACAVDVRVTNAGFGRSDVAFTTPEPIVTLTPERRLTVHLQAPGSSLLSPLILQLIPDGESGHVDAVLDSPGIKTFDQLRAVPITVKLVDQLRAIASTEAPVGVEDVTLTVEPRRLDVQVELGHPVTSNDLCRVIDLRCGKQHRLLREVTRLGASALQARFEYAPEGPCRIALSLDCSRSINTAGTAIEVTPPTAIVLRP